MRYHFDVTDSNLPSGVYNGRISSAEIKVCSRNPGEYLQVNIEIIDGNYKGRFVVERFNIVNENPATVQISKKILSKLCKAVGLKSFDDTDELVGKDLTFEWELNDEYSGTGRTKNYAKKEISVEFVDDDVPI